MVTRSHGADTNANRQRNNTCTTHHQQFTKSTQGHGHAFPLGTVRQCPRPIPLLLETRHTKLSILLHQASPRHTPQDCTHYPHSCRQSRIQETLPDTHTKNRKIRRNRREGKSTNNNDPWNTDHNNSHHKILCRTSLTDTKVLKHATEHDNSKRCLRFRWQGCVRPTSRYLPSGGQGLRNKQLPSRVQNSLRNT